MACVCAQQHNTEVCMLFQYQGHCNQSQKRKKIYRGCMSGDLSEGSLFPALFFFLFFPFLKKVDFVINSLSLATYFHFMKFLQ
jgi:hypothetical protein